MFRTQPHPTYLSTVKRYVGWGCIPNCFVLSSLPCFYAFCWSAIPTSCYIFNVCYSCSRHFSCSKCMLELKFTIYHRAASLSSQAVKLPQYMYAVLAEESLTRPGSLQTLPAHNRISNSAILHSNYILLLSDLCTCVHVKKKWHRKGSHSSSVSGSNCLVRLQTKKKKKKEKHFGHLVWYFCDAFKRHWVCCSSWKHLKTNGRSL